MREGRCAIIASVSSSKVKGKENADYQIYISYVQEKRAALISQLSKMAQSFCILMDHILTTVLAATVLVLADGALMKMTVYTELWVSEDGRPTRL